MPRWYIGAQNDGLFIIDKPPATNNDYPNHAADVNVIAAIPPGHEKLAEAIIADHNEMHERLRKIEVKLAGCR